MDILHWLEGNQKMINFAGFPETPRKALLQLLAQLYWTKSETRPLLASTLTPEELRDVLNSR